LGNPDRLLLLQQGMPDVARQLPNYFGQFPRARHVPTHDETFVQAHQIFNEGLFDQIVANGDSHSLSAIRVQCPVDQCRVHDDVAMV